MTLREHYKQLESEMGVITAENLPLCERGWITCDARGDSEPQGFAEVEKDDNIITRFVALTRGVDTLPEYYLALHEMGHIAQYRDKTGNWSTKSRFKNGVEDVDSEVDAWQWAVKNAIRPPDTETWRMIFDRLITYVTHEAYDFLKNAERRITDDPAADAAPPISVRGVVPPEHLQLNADEGLTSTGSLTAS